MSTKAFIPGIRRGVGSPMLALLSGILLVLQFVLPGIALATPVHVTAAPPTEQALALAEVSVVRIVVTYNAARQAPVECTGLGVLIASWTPTSTTDENTWVLTSGTLVNPNSATCAGKTALATLADLQVYENTAYANTAVNPINQSGFLLSPANFIPRMIVPCVTCNGNAVLFAFHTVLAQPFLDLTSTPANPAGVFGIELAQSGTLAALPPPSNVSLGTAGQYLTQVSQFLTPARNPASGTLLFATPTPVTSGTLPGKKPTATATQTPVSGQIGQAPTAAVEAGMPLIDSQGKLAGVQLDATSAFAGTELATFLSKQAALQPSAAHKTPVHDSWNAGIGDYFAGQARYAAAQQEFMAARQGSFAAPAAYLSAITQATRPGNKPKNPVGNAPASGLSISLPSGLVLLLLIIGGLVVLIVLLVLVSLRFGAARAKRKQELAHFEAERAEAERIAAADLERQRRQQGQQAQDAPVVGRNSTPGRQPVTMLSCPNCGQPVRSDADNCPNCRYLLSPSASGLHLRAQPPAGMADTPALKNGPVSSVPPVPPIPQPVAQDARPASALSDVPTLQFAPDGQQEAEKTEKDLYTLEQFSGRNLSLAVGTRTDPGIKRKYKPNEDSLLALQGARTHDSQPQQFGLFVVADGMGGHANGQDASRLAIQTIINYILPILSRGEQMGDEGFMKLLSAGVQQANQAVYQHNQERRTDMGTTMTAALVVGPMAYVTNVGDSRTYLYREPEGLRKVTHDHSVVANLVDAGVIKPDDIYTHSQRNQIYRSLGEKPVVEVDTFKEQLRPGDKLLLCSDGLWEMVRDPEILRLLRAPVSDPLETTSGLIKAALQGGGEDNVSVIVVHVTEATQQTGEVGIQLLEKPETVTVPNM